MRILVILNYYPPVEIGGWEQLTRDIVNQLVGRGHDALVLTSRHKKERINSPEPGIRRDLHLQSPDRQNYHFHYVMTDRWHEYQNKIFLKKAVSSFKPDVVFIHGMWNMSRKVALDAEVIFPDRVVYYVASTWPIDMDAHTSFWAQPHRRPWLRFLKKVGGEILSATLLRNITSHYLSFARVMCVSKFIQDNLVNQLGLPLQNTQVVHNGIDVTAFTPETKKKWDNGVLNLLYAGGFWEHKGVITAIEALGRLAHTRGLENIHLTLVGKGHHAYEKEVRDRIGELGINDLVSFGEHVPRDQMPALLRKYHILLFPSTGPEALPRIVQEAMACGLLVIGSSAGGTPEILHDGENGLVFKAGDARMLAEKISLAESDPDLRLRLSRAARRTVEDKFTIDGMVDKIEMYLSHVIRQV